MRTAKVTVLPYDETWSAEYDKIKAEVMAAVGELAIGIEHIGSTAVPGMSAKPCIDIDVVIDADDISAVIDRLATIGYVHEGDLGIGGREAFRYDGKPHLMRHHLYVCDKDSAELYRHITFRDFLRKDPDAVRSYSAVKTRAAELFSDDIDKYIEYKSPCIEKLYARCGLIDKGEEK